MYRLAPALVLAAASCAVDAADITVNNSLGTWTIDQSDLAAGPGTDLVAQIESVSAATLTISNTLGTRWQVLVSCTVPSNWPSSVSFGLRQAGAGNYLGLVCGQAPTPFLCVSGDQSGIPVQLEIAGASVRTLQPGQAVFRITYTLQSGC
jgi:hypothetical protein